ncbi:MAG: histidine--tRNA ligase [Bacilli bacterium]
MAIHPPKGTHDLYGAEAEGFRYLEEVLMTLAEFYGFTPMRTPIFEATELFARGVGASSDIVRKEMFTFPDKAGRSLTLRPEGTAGVMRAIVSNKLHAQAELPLKYYYYGPIFRYERPQRGRYREFYQFGLETIGDASPYRDVEVILYAITALGYLGLNNVVTKINFLGGAKTRDAYRQALREYFTPHIHHMCRDCQERHQLNPLRILDCKIDEDRKIIEKAPIINDFLNEEERAYFKVVTTTLDSFGINYQIDDNLVRGLDYYSDLVFEFHLRKNETEDYGALGGGGHYTELLQEVGGPALAGTGLAFGMERLYLVLKENGLLPAPAPEVDVFVMNVGKASVEDAFSILTLIRNSGYKAEINLDDRSFKALFKRAERKRAPLALIIGDDEVKENVVQIKDLAKATQVTVAYEDIISYLDEFYTREAGDDAGEKA